MNESDFCCIKQVTKSIHITIPLKYITNEIAAVSEILEGWKRQYVPKLQGVLVNYRNIRLSARAVTVHTSRTAPQCTITATFDLFCPTVGEIVKGTINRISREHIGCLIEGTINVSIHRQKHSPPELSKFIKINHPILFEIESFVYDRQTIRVKGHITPECVELMKEVFPAAQVNGFLGKDDSAQSDDLFSNTESVTEGAFSNLDNFVELTNNSELKVEETLNNALESPKIKSKKRKRESESPTVEQKKKKTKVTDPNLSNSSSNDDSSEIEQNVNVFSDTPKNKPQKRKHESESSPAVGQVDKKKLKSSDPVSESSPSDDSSDHEEKVDLNDLLTTNQESPSKKHSKKDITAEQIKKSVSDSSYSSSNDDSSDPDDESVLNSVPVAIKQEAPSPNKKAPKHHEKKSESSKKGKDKKKKKPKSSDKSESKKKKKSKKKDSKPKSKKKSKVSATGEVLKKDKKKSKKDKKNKKKDKTKNSKSEPVKIKSEID